MSIAAQPRPMGSYLAMALELGSMGKNGGSSAFCLVISLLFHLSPYSKRQSDQYGLRMDNQQIYFEICICLGAIILYLFELAFPIFPHFQAHFNNL